MIIIKLKEQFENVNWVMIIIIFLIYSCISMYLYHLGWKVSWKQTYRIEERIDKWSENINNHIENKK